MTDAIVLQQPQAPAQQLLLLFHGVGGSPPDLVPLGRLLAQAFPNACVVSVQAPHAGDSGRGYQWFSAKDITENNRPERVANAMPAFLAEVAHWQAAARLGPEATALIGFSQGGIMALEATKSEIVPAGRVVALGGRFAQLPTAPAQRTTIHLIHGKEDRVLPYGLAVAACERLLALGTDVTADVLPLVGHEVTEEMATLVLERLQRYLPQWRWQEAMRSAPDPEEPGSSARQAVPPHATQGSRSRDAVP